MQVALMTVAKFRDTTPHCSASCTLKDPCGVDNWNIEKARSKPL